MTLLDPEEKDRLAKEFRSCLDALDPGDGPDEDSVDLRTLLAEMALLKNDVRHETRQSREVLRELRNFGEILKQEHERISLDLERQKEATATERQQREREILLGVLEIRDRIESGAAAIIGKNPSRLGRFFLSELRFIESVGEGMAMTLRRVDEFLARYRVRAFSCTGLPLDPGTMRAMGIETAPDLPEGAVVRELRKGFLMDGELLRVAEVIVNKNH